MSFIASIKGRGGEEKSSISTERHNQVTYAKRAWGSGMQIEPSHIGKRQTEKAG